MSTGRIIATVAAVILILAALPICLISFFFLWGAFSPQGEPSWIGIGVFGILVGLVMIGGGIAAALWARQRQKAEAAAQNVTLKIDLPANVNLDTLKCQSCGGVLTMDNIQMVAGAPVVHCPYCKTTYQLSEDPKW